MKTCFLFPGQGAQFPGMSKDLHEYSAAVRELFQTASDVCGIDVKHLLFEADEAHLNRTDLTQIAMAVADTAAAIVCHEHGIDPDGVAGFSLGEFPALHAAGVLDTEDYLRLVKRRGELMEKHSRSSDDSSGAAGMIAVLGLGREAAQPVLEELADFGAFLANHSSPAQLVIAGTGAGLARAEEAFSSAGARRVIRLKVSGPFHSPLLEEARLEFESELGRVVFRDPKLPVYANVTGTRIQSGSEAQTLCAQQIVSTVEWVAEEEAIRGDGYERMLETGPGTVLCGLWKSFNRGEPACVPAGTTEAIQAL
ncbi:MAG: ACP S-malonyltransferase [Spirochaetaceae bacterium]